MERSRGILGSLAYVDRHLATRAPSNDPALANLPNNRTWRSRWPIQPRPGYRDLVAYFNLDNGSGKIRGINAEGNVAAAPIFQEWLAPFASMGATTVSLRNSGGTDHVYMQTVGVPGYQFIQDPLDYSARIHHTSIDSYDHLKAEDLRQAAVILASFLLNAANRDAPLPRMPLRRPSRPRPIRSNIRRQIEVTSFRGAHRANREPRRVAYRLETSFKALGRSWLPGSSLRSAPE
ncbi:M28 family peptidase [Brevundimonas sp. SORGH_AS_0993]|uniref:M28 family peptidase n=1 Tax=Brevundimonas sp. SORGH_AS_0993 TaxID=3041794 RepID=UPI0027D8865A|nr:M28 family peptidase [Brevundimonas sp. SORGH_AS_0993]